ncbi:MAG: hypothetical protein P4M00_17000 [Azospirillaceae bacterium]|nr:hypothetical protein [Azospirillaceae bacterium]
MSASTILKLQKVGFTTEQVEALADFMDIQAASKADLGATKGELKAEIAATKSELNANLAATRSELKANIAELAAEVAEIRSDLKLLEQRMTIKLGGMLVVITGILLAAIRYLPPPLH